MLGSVYVKNLMGTMLVEIPVIFAAGAYGGIAARQDLSHLQRTLTYGGSMLLFGLLVAVAAAAFGSTWPIHAFVWLFFSRGLLLWTHPQQSAANLRRSSLLCLGSIGGYCAAAILTAYPVWPEWGLKADFVHSMQLSGDGSWIKYPQTVIVGGILYFAFQCWLKFRLAR